uniref:Uncharacterized protein n=1 Tax=Anguilla anguilla TaxID=7936 RepID=A0A0E9VN85_ANGAN
MNQEPFSVFLQAKYPGAVE